MIVNKIFFLLPLLAVLSLGIGNENFLAYAATFTSSDSTYDVRILETSNNDICDISGSYNLVDDNVLTVGSGVTASSTDCHRSVIEWDISSIPDNAVITDVDVSFETGSIGTANNCEWNPITNQPSISATGTVFADIADGTPYADNNAECTTVGINRLVDLGTSADSDLQALLSSDWFAVGIQAENEAVGVSSTLNTLRAEPWPATPDPTLTVTYFLPPDAVDDLTVANLANTSLDLLWTQPNLNSGTLENYLINFTTPHGVPVTFLANSTNLYYNVTGINFGTDYSYRVSALTEWGYNATGNILNITTPTTVYSLPPTDLQVFAHGNTTQLDLEWTASTIDNIVGYKIERETPKGSGWSTIVANTTNTNVFYNNTGLTTNVIYNYRVTAINGSGLSTVSNEYDMTTFKLPNAVTDLVATATSLSSVELSWTTPLHFAPEIIGYMVNYTTPHGIPNTILTNNSFSDSPMHTVTNLGIGSDVSFRVAPVTVHGLNATGNIVNSTTFSDFTIGELNIIDEVNTDIIDVLFTRTDLSASSTQLDVRYPNTVTDFRCTFSYKFAQTNQTYSSLSSSVFDTNYDTSSFVFTNSTNDIIDAYCWDNSNTIVNGTYRLTQQTFPFVTMINQFQDGQFKTAGQFGVLDLITVIVILISMIGFNRSNPAAGIIIAVMVLGATAFFGIIEFPTIIAGVIALIVMLAVVTTRKS